MKSDIENFLYQFVDYPQKIAPIFEEIINHTELKPLEFLTKSGEKPTDIFIVKSGIIRSYFLNEDGKEITKAFFTPSFVAGATSTMMQNKISDVNYQALTDVTGYRANFFKLKELTLKHHEMSIFYIKALEDAYLKTESVILDISTLTATERYLSLKDRIPDIDNLISQRYIASYLNITPVQLSRIRKKLLFG